DFILVLMHGRLHRARKSTTMSLHLKISSDDRGSWSVHGLPSLPVKHLPSLAASIDYARQEGAAAPATIELLIDGFYAVVHQERGWPRRLIPREKPCRGSPCGR